MTATPLAYVVFDSSWVDPPGQVVATFRTAEEAQAHCDKHWGNGWLVVEVPGYETEATS